MKTILKEYYNCALELLTTRSLEETYKLIVDQACELFRADYGSIFDNRDNTFQREYSTVPESSQVQPRKRGYSAKAYLEGSPYILCYEDILKSHSEIKNKNIRMFIIIPLMYHKEAIGTLSLQSLTDIEYSEEEWKVLTLYGSIASLAITKARLNKDEPSIVTEYDSTVKSFMKENQPSALTLEEFSERLKKKLFKGDTPQYIWAEMLLWEAYQNIQTIKSSLSQKD